MSKTKKYVVVGLGFLLLLGVFVFDQPQVGAQSTKPPQQVQVMNAAGAAPGQNVPISGNVGISTMPNVAISSMPNVTISSMPSVTVGNLPAAPVPVRDVDNPARQPFQAALFIGFAEGSTCVNGSINVPSGKQLVIEYVSAGAQLPTGQKLVARQMGILRANNTIFHQLGATFLGTNTLGKDVFVTSQQTRLYPDSTTTSIPVNSCRSGDTGTGSEFVTISGYLVNLT